MQTNVHNRPLLRNTEVQSKLSNSSEEMFCESRLLYAKHFTCKTDVPFEKQILVIPLVRKYVLKYILCRGKI